MSPASTHPQRNRKDGEIKMWCLAAKGCGERKRKKKKRKKRMMEREKVVVVLVLVLHASRSWSSSLGQG